MATQFKLPGHKAGAAILAWARSAEDLARIKAVELERRQELVEKLFADAGEGTTTLDLGNGFVLVCEKGVRYKLDPEKTRAAEAALRKLGKVGDLIAKRLLKWKPDISVREYKALEDEHAALFSDALTITQSTPTLKLRPPKDE